jgi:hypothetical protein
VRATRVAYVQCDTDEESIARLIRLGEKVYEEIQALPPSLSTPAPALEPQLQGEIDAIASEDDFYWVKGDTVTGGIIVSRFDGKVDFSDQLNNRIVNFVPVVNFDDVLDKCDDATESVPIYPESLREQLGNALAVCGVQRTLPMVGHSGGEGWLDDAYDVTGLPHDGIEPERRMVRWVIDQSAKPAPVAATGTR